VQMDDCHEAVAIQVRGRILPPTSLSKLHVSPPAPSKLTNGICVPRSSPQEGAMRTAAQNRARLRRSGNASIIDLDAALAQL
jgi:hypothetical protein